jgi:hypothetical protein
MPSLSPNFALPACGAVDDWLVVARELEPQLRAVAGQFKPALQARHSHRLESLDVHQANVAARRAHR